MTAYCGVLPTQKVQWAIKLLELVKEKVGTPFALTFDLIQPCTNDSAGDAAAED